MNTQNPKKPNATENEDLITMNWSTVSEHQLNSLRGLCFDIDETFSTQGKLTPEAFSALWNLKQAGFVLVPISGRPAGWCDHIARFWPVDAVIGENGAFVFFMHQGKRKRIDTPKGVDTQQLLRKLNELRGQIEIRFPEVLWASDQKYREFDLAIDICEDVPAWSRNRVIELLDFCQTQGATAKLSSIHVNVWYGDYDKKKGFLVAQNELFPGLKLDEWIFVGDSPNDEPLFSFFPMSVGVSNIQKYLTQLQFKPTWITASASGLGFAEIADLLIRSRQERR